MTFITLLGTVEEKLNSIFNIINVVTYRIECILKAVLEFMLSQMTKSKSNSCNIFDPDRIMAIKKQIRRRPYEFQYVTFENTVAIASS